MKPSQHLEAASIWIRKARDELMGPSGIPCTHCINNAIEELTKARVIDLA